MRDFNRGNRGFGGKRNFGNRGGNREMFRATCSNCGRDCEVPFRPTGSKPVLCRECFAVEGGRDGRRAESRDERRFERRGNDRPQFSEKPQYKEQLVAINTKLDRILQLLEPVAPAVQEEKVVTELENLTPEVLVAPEKKKSTRTKKAPPIEIEEA